VTKQAAWPTVGLLINPMAGRDIRRLVALAPAASTPAKVLVARRLLRGVRALGPLGVVVPDDADGIARQLAREEPDVRVVEAPTDLDGAAATVAWVRRLEAAGAAVLMTVGGDGTQRAVAKAATALPVLPVAGGTNNVSCWAGEDTVAGMAAAIVALGWAPGAVRRVKRLRLTTGDGRTDVALVDAAQVAIPVTGALAVYDGGTVSALVLTVADATRPGLSNVGGFVDPVGAADDWALVLRLGRRGPRTPVVLAPGLVERVRVAAARRLPLGESVTLKVPYPSTIALDGERTLTLKAGEPVRVTLDRGGPAVIDPAAALQALPERLR
jgi:hypothetical protein